MARNAKQEFIDQVRAAAEDRVDLNDMTAEWINKRLVALGIPPIEGGDPTPPVRYPLTVWVKADSGEYDNGPEEALDQIANNADPNEDWEEYERDEIPNGWISKIELPAGTSGVNKGLAEAYDAEARRWIPLTEWEASHKPTSVDLPVPPPLRELRAHVRQIIVDARREFNHCLDGTNRVLRELGLDELGSEQRYTVRVPAVEVEVQVTATSEDEARAFACKPDMIRRGRPVGDYTVAPDANITVQPTPRTNWY